MTLARRSLALQSSCVLLALCVPAGGCGLLDYDNRHPEDEGWDESEPDPEPEPEPWDDVPPSPPEPVPEIDVDACAGSASAFEIARHVELAYVFGERVADLHGFGVELRRLAAGLDDGLTWLQDPAGSSLPEGFVVAGEGVFAFEPGVFEEARMEVRFYLARDYGFGSEGDLLLADPFALSSYLREPVVTMHEDGGGIEIAHAGPGPLAELLDLGVVEGEALPNPLVVANPLTFADARLELAVEADVRLADEHFDTTVELDVKVPRRLADSVLDRDPITLNALSVAGLGPWPEQSLALERWNLAQVEDTPMLGEEGVLGEVEIEASGGLFRWRAFYTFDGSTTPGMLVRCG